MLPPAVGRSSPEDGGRWRKTSNKVRARYNTNDSFGIRCVSDRGFDGKCHVRTATSNPTLFRTLLSADLSSEHGQTRDVRSLHAKT